jgi:aromatase
MQAEPAVVYQLASRVEDWPHILPHYRWVRVHHDVAADRRTVEMAARRDVVGRLGIPLRWTALQTLYPAQLAIEFDHVRGITRGMHVRWDIGVERDGAVVASIRHIFSPHWPVPEFLIHAIVGEYFVNGVAKRTLRRIGELAERRSVDA